MNQRTIRIARVVLVVSALALCLPALYGSSPAAGDGRGAYLGVQIVAETVSADGGGARVQMVVEGSPADKAGLRDGDVIVAIAGEQIRGPFRLTEKIHAMNPGDRTSIELIRDGERKTVDVESGERNWSEQRWFGEGDEPFVVPMPDSESWKDIAERSRELAERSREFAERWREQVEAREGEWFEGSEDLAERIRERVRDLGRGGGSRPLLFRMAGRPKLGVQLVETTPELRVHLGGSEDAGVLVSKVIGGTPAERGGVRVGDLILAVDGEQVRTAANLIEVLADKDGSTIEIELVREGRKSTIRVAIPEDRQEEEITGPRAALAPLPAVPPTPGTPALAPLPALPPTPGTPALAPLPALPPTPETPALAPLPALPPLPGTPALAPLPGPPAPLDDVTLV